MSYYRLQPRGGRPAAGAAPALPVVCLDELHTLTVQTAVSGTASLLSYHMDKLFGRRDLAVVFCRWKRTIWINSSVGGSAAPLSHFFHVFSLLLPLVVTPLLSLFSTETHGNLNIPCARRALFLTETRRAHVLIVCRIPPLPTLHIS